MRIDIIDSYEAFMGLRAQWDRAYEQDPEAQFFLSWKWLSKWLEDDEGQWFVLAASSDSDPATYVAFFPLRLHTRMRQKGGFYNEISLAGRKLSDYAGFICMPEFLGNVIKAYARHLKRSHWSCLKLECLCASDARIRQLMQHFRGKSFNIHDIEDFNKRDNIDNHICPSVNLPGDWPSYLASLSSNTRQKARRFLRKVEDSDEFSVRLADVDSIEDDLKILLDFWKTKWGRRKGSRLQTIVNINFSMLKKSFECGALFLPVLRRGDRPLAALASFVDPVKGSLLFFIGGRDEEFAGPPPSGFVLHAFSIRHAIEQGFTTYDFLRGNEPYKYLFRPDEHKIRHIIVSTSNRQNLGGQLDSRCLLKVLKRTVDLHKAGQLAQAEVGYNQVLAVSPGSETALYGLGQLMAQKGEHVAATRAFRTLVTKKPQAEKAWLRLGASLEARRRFSDAADAYRELIRHQPSSQAAHYKLAGSLNKLGQSDLASKAYNTAIGLHPPQ